jgi:predicted PurR-regulated permease PerM
MLGIEPRAARYAWTVAAIVGLLVVVFLIRTTLFVFVAALLFAYLLSPLVDLIDRFLPASRTRTPALALAYVFFVAVLVLAGMQVGGRVVEQANALAQRFPDMVARWQQSIEIPQSGSLQHQVFEKIREQVQLHANELVAALPQAGLRLLALAGDLLHVIMVPILAFFFLKDGRGIRQHFIGAIEGESHRALAHDLIADVHLLLAHYMRALFLLSLATFLCYGLFFAVAGVPYALLLAAVAFALEFIPMIGPLTAAILIVLVAAVSGGPVLAILGFLGAYRLFQDYVLTPYLMGSGVELHPLLVIFGVFAGAELAGIPGTFLSVPALALLRILYRRVRKQRELVAAAA